MFSSVPSSLDTDWFPVTPEGQANEMASALLSGSGPPERDRSLHSRDSHALPLGRIFLVCDGVLDNGPELTGELKRLGRSVRSRGQWSIVLAAFEEWGPACLARLKGSFACAAVDFERRCLILARDAFGTRPLYYSIQNHSEIVFASRIAALLEFASVTPRVNRDSLYRYLVHNTMDHAPETFFADIRQVPPGHYLEAPLHRPSEWSVKSYRETVPAQTKLTIDEAAQNLRELVMQSVASQVGAQKPIGAALSGGFDSSFVISAFERSLPDTPLQLYTCVPLVKDGSFSQSEEYWADLAASGFRSPVNKVRVSVKDLPAQFDSIVCLQEEPFSSPVVFAQLQLFRAAQDHGIQMMLSGQGGDTMFASSTQQVLRAVLAHLRRGRWGDAAAVWGAATRLPHQNFRQLTRAAAMSAMPRGLRAFAKRFVRPPAPEWLKHEWFELDSSQPVSNHGLPMLRFEDRNSTSCAILNRMPLLTVEIQDFVRSLPPEYIVSADQPMKSIECAALRGMVSEAILARRERSGFPVPVREWLCELSAWVDTSIEPVSCLPFLESRRVRHLWELVRSQNASMSEGFLIWRWLFLSGWLRNLDVRLD
jgi:asparagine synthase (glutamine-hydrolysing)